MYLTNILHIAPNKTSNIAGQHFNEFTINSPFVTVPAYLVSEIAYKYLLYFQCP